MNIQNIELGLMKYIKNEIANKIPNPLLKFGLYTMTFYKGLNVEKMLDEYMSLIRSLGVVNDEGVYNVDELHNAMLEAMKECKNVVLYGITFDESDVNKLFQYIHEQN